MTRRASPVLLVLGLLVGAAGPAVAEWPYLTEEAANLTEGRYSLSLGAGYTDRQTETRFVGQELISPPRGVYWAAPMAQGTLGVGPRAEVSFEYEFLHFQPPDGGASHRESGDLRLWTKLGLLNGGRHALSGRFGVKLPNSSKLGSNETDFFASALYDLTLGEWVATGNLGVAVVGNPARSQMQDDLLTWALALAWGGRGDGGLRCGVEVAGTNGPYGLERQRDGRFYAGVLGWRWGRWRLDGSLRYGRHDWEGWGWLAGLTYDR